ncbi:AraC family transcriptional regulator [Paenibacillus sp. FSL L8-0470]|uniref:AraC family transcriptional regulator n=1 Tax=unclassified Paenibacillus TaxID=185978 RepID=UPI0030F927A7
MKHSQYYEKIAAPLLAGIGNSPLSPTKDFHIHDHYEIFLFLNGTVNGFVDQYCYPLQRGSVLVFNNQEIHKIINLSPGPYERVTIHFKAELVYPFCTAETNLLACFQNHQPGKQNISQMDEPQLNEYMRLASRLIDALNHPQYGSDVLALTYLVQLLVFINGLYNKSHSPVPSIISALIESAIHYIDNHLHTSLSLEQVSSELAVDKYYLSHLFKQQTGGTLYRYVLLKKIALAKQLLAGGKSVSETCYLAGFNDYANFIRTFKNIAGVSPGKYSRST